MNKKILRIMTFMYTFMLAYNLAQGEILELGLYEPEQIIPQIDEDGADVILNSNEDY